MQYILIHIIVRRFVVLCIFTTNRFRYMYYRRKVILALLEKSNGIISRLKLQKLLFLISRHQEKPVFDFVPYKFGAYSFRATADARTLVKYGILTTVEEKSWVKNSSELFFKQLKKKDQQILNTVFYQFGSFSGKELIKYTYTEYPYYAINSTIAHRYLTQDQLDRIQEERPIDNQKDQLFTIGYEGLSAEAYFNKLIKNNVRALVDVRRNAASMKYGFHKSQLTQVCNSLGLKYYHIPEVGIDNGKRKSLKSQKDYDELFSLYCEETLPNTRDSQNEILTIFENHKRIALTCFEALPCQCHRSHLADYLLSSQTSLITEPCHL